MKNLNFPKSKSEKGFAISQFWGKVNGVFKIKVVLTMAYYKEGAEGVYFSWFENEFEVMHIELIKQMSDLNVI